MFTFVLVVSEYISATNALSVACICLIELVGLVVGNRLSSVPNLTLPHVNITVLSLISVNISKLLIIVCYCHKWTTTTSTTSTCTNFVLLLVVVYYYY